MTAREVKALRCSAEAKALIQRCIGPRRKRFLDASTMLRAMLRFEQKQDRPLVESIQGKRIVFTGALQISRDKAHALAQLAGGVPQRRVDGRTDIVVVGARAPQWKADAKGQKLLDVDLEIERGHEVAVWDERQFFKAVGRRPSRTRA
jgi:NAD-dependent DNA ligase